MKRSWHPLDVGGLRLYQVGLHFMEHPQWNKTLIVAANSPSEAEKLMAEIYLDDNITYAVEKPILSKGALNIYMPTEWWEKGYDKEAKLNDFDNYEVDGSQSGETGIVLNYPNEGDESVRLRNKVTGEIRYKQLNIF